MAPAFGAEGLPASMRSVLADPDEDLADRALLDGVVRGGGLLEREPCQRQSGVLADGEFAAAKTKLLER